MMSRAFRKRCRPVATIVVALGSAFLFPVGLAAEPAPTLKAGAPSALKAEDLHALRAILKTAVDDKSLPGDSLLLAHRGEIIFCEAFGNLTTDSVIPVASVTKPVTATTILKLVEQGKLRLDDPINKAIPEFAQTKVRGGQEQKTPITVRMLLSHTSGVGSYTAANRDFTKTTAECVRATAATELQSQPGERYSYTGAGFDVAARVAEVATGEPFEELVQKHVFTPLGMSHTSFNKPAGAAQNRPGEGRYLQAGGGLRSSLNDLAIFYQMLLNGGRYGDVEILKPESIAEMRNKQSSPPGSGQAAGAREYGIGIFRYRPNDAGQPQTFGHGGALGTIPWFDLDRHLVGVFMTQSQLARATPVANRVQDKIRQIIPAQASR